MPRRGENIRKRKDGRWEARYKKGTDMDGTAIYGSVYAKTYREVKEKRTEVLQFHDRSVPHKQLTFQDAVIMWEKDNHIRLKGASECRYQYLINTHILPSLGTVRLSLLTGQMVNTFLAEKLENGRLDGHGGLSPAYVRSMMIIINSVLKYASDTQLCQPLRSQINKPPVVKKEVPVLQPGDRDKLEHYLMQDTDGTKLGVLISMYSGLRIGEICALQWKDVDLDNQVLNVRHTVARVSCANALNKTASKLIIDRPKTTASFRSVPICSKLAAVLRSCALSAKSEFVISDKEDFVNPRTYEYRYHKLLSTCGIPPINYHALRHTFATRCIESGVDPKTLSEILGHANVSITLTTYVHSSMELKRAQMEKLV